MKTILLLTTTLLLTLSGCDNPDQTMIDSFQAAEARVCGCTTPACMLAAVEGMPTDEAVAVASAETRKVLKLSQVRMMRCVQAMQLPG